MNHGCSSDVWLHDQVDHHPDAAVLALVHQLDEVAQAAEPRVDAVVVGDVVAVVPAGRGVDRVQPQGADPEPAEVVEPADQPVEVADTASRRPGGRSNRITIASPATAAGSAAANTSGFVKNVSPSITPASVI